MTMQPITTTNTGAPALPSKWNLRSGAVIVMLFIASLVVVLLVFGLAFAVFKHYWKKKDKLSRENYLFNLEENYQKAISKPPAYTNGRKANNVHVQFDWKTVKHG